MPNDSRVEVDIPDLQRARPFAAWSEGSEGDTMCLDTCASTPADT